MAQLPDEKYLKDFKSVGLKMTVALLPCIRFLILLITKTLCADDTDPRGARFHSLVLRNASDSAVDTLQSQSEQRFDFQQLGSLGELLGEGTYGSVRLLWGSQGDTNGFQIAVKSFWDVESKTDINHEFLVASSLQHPNIVSTFDLRETFNGTHTLYHQFMEYLPYNLPAFTTAFLRPRQNLYRVFRQVCEGVAYLHSCGLAHLDLKPENILVTSEGIPKIIDFGSSEAVVPAAPLLTSSASNTSVPVLVRGPRGSEPYMPPEVYGEAAYDGLKADIWALGIVFVQIALEDYAMPWAFSAMEDTAFATFVGSATEEQNTVENEAATDPRMHHQTQEVASPVRMTREELLRHLPRESRSMVGRMLDLKPAGRPSIDEVLEAPWL